MPNGSSHLREFDKFRLDLDKKVLWHLDEPVHLPPKAVEVLCGLVEKQGEVVTRDELLDNVWGDSFVEESVLSQNIHHLRKALRDLKIKGDPIQTIPRRGYRFAAKLRDVGRDIILEHEVVEREFILTSAEAVDIDRRSAAHRYISVARIGRKTSVIVIALACIALLAVYALWSDRRSTTGSSRANISSLAVLPLIPIGDKDADSPMSLGLTDALIVRLGGLKRLAVRPYSSVAKYNDSGRDAISFAGDLRVDAVLEGTVQRAGGRVRVNLRLMDPINGSQIWAASFDETETDLLKLQDAISNRVVKELRPNLDPAEDGSLAKLPTTNPDAYLLYIAGRDLWLRRLRRNEPLLFYKKAIELDPDFALAYLGIADQHAFNHSTDAAEVALRKALELDPSLAEAHATKGFVQMFHNWDWRGAERSFQTAIQLAPQSSKTRHWYGVYLSLQGRLDEAIAEMERALELDPTALVVKADIAQIYYFKRDYQRSREMLDSITSADPTFINARAYSVKVRYKLGASYFRESASFDLFMKRQESADGAIPQEEVDMAELRFADRADEIRKDLIERATLGLKGQATEAGTAYDTFAVLGDKKRTLDALEKAIEARVFVLPYVAVDPLFDFVRDERRFQEILRRINLGDR